MPTESTSKLVTAPTPAASSARPTSAEVKLAGWVHSYRDHGGLVFIDLRDRDGLTQLVFDADLCGKAIHDEARKLRSEWVISVAGEVDAARRGAGEPEAADRRDRGAGQDDGGAQRIARRRRSRPTSTRRSNEEQRLQYRYLDLRRPEMQETLRTRYRVTKIMRDYLGDLGFWEIETPFLTKSTPEGARDFIVPGAAAAGQLLRAAAVAAALQAAADGRRAATSTCRSSAASAMRTRGPTGRPSSRSSTWR